VKPRIIVCGLGRTGYRIFCLLRQQGAEIVGISTFPLPNEKGDNIVIGDLKAVPTLLGAGIKTAQTIVLASGDDALNLAILTQARLLNPQIRIVNRLFNQTLGDRLDRTLPDHFSMSVSALAAPIFAFTGLGNRAIGQLRLYDCIWPIHEEVIDADHPWLGMLVGELWDNPTRMLIYYFPAKGEIDLVSAVVRGHRLEKGDHLIIGDRLQDNAPKKSILQQLSQLFSNLPQYQRHFRPVTIVSLILLAVIFLATLIYVSVNVDTSIVDALYFSVGTIAGGGGEEQIVEGAPDSIKLFTTFLMLVGAGIVGICYALINDFILGSRLKEFLDAARVPTRNHYIVCGLGGIGIQILRHLKRQGYEVVAIESDANNRFLHTARSLGVPVIVEDARVCDTLKVANVQTAAALITVTSDDLIDLEIALTGRAIAPKVAVVVRCYDPQFAQSMQQVFGFDAVLSPIELATPAFAAAALGGRILGNGMTQDLLWIALATPIVPTHPFLGKTIQQAAMEADFVPLYLESDRKTIHSWQLLETYLQVGDVLYLTMPATKLEQLWRSDRSFDNELVDLLQKS
jgi:Trk K+ transport system NAD-binding subunit